jgi:hypothetical protein
MDVTAIADALAARYASANITPPTGEINNIRLATADPPQALDVFPAVLVFAMVEPAEFSFGANVRKGLVPFNVEFYLGTDGDLKRQARRLHAWAGVLLDATLTSTHLGLGAVVALTWARRMQIGVLEYAGAKIPGIAISVAITTSEGISPTA